MAETPASLTAPTAPTASAPKAAAPKKPTVSGPQTFKALKTCFTADGRTIEEGTVFTTDISGYVNKTTGEYECPPYLEEVDEE